ncbi:MAG: VOC family protein [Spirochaetes bacterium]|nr:VOC family protein [Spirochaetota bacterium]
MKIEHIGIWVNDIEKMKLFYEDNFGFVSSNRYVNTEKQFTSYFLKVNGSARIELMKIPESRMTDSAKGQNYYGFAHIAFSTGSKEKVISLTETLRDKGYIIFSEPRTTGDGYFESVVLDPEGNKIEITE